MQGESLRSWLRKALCTTRQPDISGNEVTINVDVADTCYTHVDAALEKVVPGVSIQWVKEEKTQRCESDRILLHAQKYLVQIHYYSEDGMAVALFACGPQRLTDKTT